MNDVIPFPEREPVEGQLVDADGDGEPDRHHGPGELVERPEATMAVPVDQAWVPPISVQAKRVERRPVLPKWVRSRDEAQQVAKWAIGHAGHVTAYHAVRLPVYVSKLVAWSPLGLAKLTYRTGRWVFDTEAREVRLDAVRRNDADMYLKLERQHSEHVRRRALLAGLVVTLATIAGVLVILFGPGWVTALLATATTLGLGLAGAPRDKPIAGHAVIVERYTRLTSQMVERALQSLGIAAMTAKEARIVFPAPIQRDGPGWRAEVDLPYGVTATDVVERRDRLSAGLRRPLGCVWPEPVSDAHAGRLVLWVGDQDMAKAKPAVWPLAKGVKANVFQPLPFGVDQRGRPVGLPLMYDNLLIGALPGAGKTFALRVVVLGAAMDPTCELRVFELKGSGDLDAIEAVAHHFGSGADDDTAERCLQSLREVYVELETRAATVKRLAKSGRAPENKVIRELADDPTLGLHPMLFVIDECQELFTHPVYGKDAASLCTAIIKRGRALGIMLALATQRPDKDSLPKAISDNVGIRFCLRVTGQPANDMILGTSAYKNGIRATMLRPSDKGVGWLVGASDDPQIARSYYVDGPGADKAVQMARYLREQAGTLSGAATGEKLRTVTAYDDVLLVFGSDAKLWTATLLERLAQLRPDVYEGWTPDQLAAALRPFGMRPTQVWATGADGAGANRKGYERPDPAQSIEGPVAAS
ncbi:hypothetical protein BAY59_24195 [Prauserella coralliicola]|nr:hypothetical protein BAY59_24195 [Prauserella coralliicola]